MDLTFGWLRFMIKTSDQKMCIENKKEDTAMNKTQEHTKTEQNSLCLYCVAVKLWLQGSTERVALVAGGKT